MLSYFALCFVFLLCSLMLGFVFFELYGSVWLWMAWYVMILCLYCHVSTICNVCNVCNV